MKRGRPGYDQELVLQIAVDAFNEHGFEATSVARLAERLGTTKSALYHHFDSKEDLLRRALDRALGSLENSIQPVLDSQASALERLELTIRATVRVLTEQLPFVTLLLRLRGNTAMEREALARRRSIDRKIAALVEQAQEEGSLRRDIDPKTCERLIFGAVNSLVDWYRPGGKLSPKALADTIVSLALDGLRR